VVSFARRLAAVVAIVTLSVGNLAVCAGWQPTPEARMACCKNGTACPMHASESRGSSSTRIITQAQADNCCAATSNRTQSSIAGSTFELSGVTALPSITGRVAPIPVLALQEWRAFVPLPLSPVPRHLLLSVLLV
jgi:hypothetical protein